MRDSPLSGAGAARHIGDEDVVRLLDAAPVVPAPLSMHLAECAACSARVTELTAAARELRLGYRAIQVPERMKELPLRVRIREHAAPARTSGWEGRSLELAAGFLLVMAIGVAAAAPIRRFFLDVNTPAAHGGTTMPVAAAPRLRVDTASMAFGVSSASITLDFAAPPGTLRARLGSTDTLLLSMTSTAPLHTTPSEPSLVALPDGIRVVNTPDPHAAYEVTVPAAAQEVHVRLRGREVTVLRRPELSATAETVPLKEGAKQTP